MKFTLTHDFAYPIETVWEMFRTPESHVAKFERMGHQDLEVVESEQTDTSLDLVIRRQVEMEIPSVAKKFLQPKNLVTSTDHWQDNGDGTYGGHFTVDIKGAPAESRGNTSLEPIDGDSCHYTVEVDVRVKVPLVGDKIAGALKPQLVAQLSQEFDAAEEWLAG